MESNLSFLKVTKGNNHALLTVQEITKLGLNRDSLNPLDSRVNEVHKVLLTAHSQSQ